LLSGKQLTGQYSLYSSIVYIIAKRFPEDMQNRSLAMLFE